MQTFVLSIKASKKASLSNESYLRFELWNLLILIIIYSVVGTYDGRDSAPNYSAVGTLFKEMFSILIVKVLD